MDDTVIFIRVGTDCVFHSRISFSYFLIIVQHFGTHLSSVFFNFFTNFFLQHFSVRNQGSNRARRKERGIAPPFAYSVSAGNQLTVLARTPAVNTLLIHCFTNSQSGCLGGDALANVNVIDAIGEPDADVALSADGAVDDFACLFGSLTFQTVEADLPASLVFNDFSVPQGQAVILCEVADGANIDAAISSILHNFLSFLCQALGLLSDLIIALGRWFVNSFFEFFFIFLIPLLAVAVISVSVKNAVKTASHRFGASAVFETPLIRAHFLALGFSVGAVLVFSVTHCRPSLSGIHSHYEEIILAVDGVSACVVCHDVAPTGEHPDADSQPHGTGDCGQGVDNLFHFEFLHLLLSDCIIAFRDAFVNRFFENFSKNFSVAL